jgi:acetyl-CoA carboxylase biotin carboxyl carrier protein
MNMAKTPRKSSDEIANKVHLIRELAQIMEETGLVEVDFEDDKVSVHLSKAGSVSHAPMMAAHAPIAAPAPTAAAPAPAPEATADADLENAINSPMVGRAYLAPEPGAAVFVKEGDSVKAGQTLLIIEAMKVMNPITAPNAGVVRRILIEDGQPIEFGEPLIIIE